MRIARRAALLLPFLLAACSKPEPPSFEPFDFDYLTKIKLDVGTIEIDDAWAPRGAARHVEYIAPTRPTKALRLMAEQRLVTGGSAGQALFGIDDASIILYRGRFEASFAVHLELQDADGKQIGIAQARARAARPATDEEDITATQIDLDSLMRKLMGDLNVEFEFQVKQALKQSLQNTAPDAPAPGPVDSQDLSTAPPPT